MNVYDAIKIKALGDVVKGSDSDYLLRKVFRWYSKTFHTPLHLVDELPTETILQAYWEEHFEGMEEQAIEAERKDILWTKEDQLKEDYAYDEEQLDNYVFARDLGKVDQKAVNLKDVKTEKGFSVEPKKTEAPSFEGLANLSKVLENIKELPQDVHMKFVSEEEMSSMLDEDGIAPPEKPKKQS